MKWQEKKKYQKQKLIATLMSESRKNLHWLRTMESGKILVPQALSCLLMESAKNRRYFCPFTTVFSLIWRPQVLSKLHRYYFLYLFEYSSFLSSHPSLHTSTLWKEWCWSWNSSTLATSCKELNHWKRLWCWEGLGAGGEGDDRGWHGWMASPTRWTWVWVNSRSWWWTGRPGVLQFMGLQRVGHDWATELNWTEHLPSYYFSVSVQRSQLLGMTEHKVGVRKAEMAKLGCGICIRWNVILEM